MLRGQVMVGAHNRPFEQAPGALDGIRVHVAAYPFVGSVGYRLMARVLIADSAVAKPFVGVDRFGIAANVLLDEPVKGRTIRPLVNPEADIPAALDRSENHRHMVPKPAAADFLAQTSAVVSG